MITKRYLAAVLVLPILAASLVQAVGPSGRQAVGQAGRQEALLNDGKADWFAMRTKSAEQKLIGATKNPTTRSEAHYWLGRIYQFKGTAENAFPGFHEQVSYRPRAEVEFKAAGEPRPEWIAEGEKFDSDLKAADAAIAALRENANASAAAIRSAIEARIELRPDPMAYSAGATLLLARQADLPFVLRLAAEGKTAGERFIRENEDSYRLDGKVQGSLDRNAATFTDIAGWALFMQGDLAGAEARLSEAARLFRNNDPNNQFHLAELSARRGNRNAAEDHYLNVIELANGPANAQQRIQAQTALFTLRAATGESAEESKAWLAEMLDRKREQRRQAMTSNMLGRKLPAVVLKDLQGKTVDLSAERGNVILLNFWASW